MDVLAIAPGLTAGCILWYIFVRPRQLRNHERERRELGLPPKRKLPEDQ